jgi:methionyl-tRNA synthetase
VALALEVREEYAREMSQFRLNSALEAAWQLVARMNKYIDEQAPWALSKAAKQGDSAAEGKLKSVLYDCLEAVRVVSGLAEPFMPRAAVAIRKQLGIEETATAWDDLNWGGLKPESRLGETVPLFPRIQELEVDEATVWALGSANPEPAPTDNAKESRKDVESTAAPSANAGAPVTVAPPTETEQPITIDDFMKVQLRVGEILAAEPVPNATKL